MTVQIAVKLPGHVLTAIDELVDDGRFDSRSDVVRTGLSLVLERARAERIDRSFSEGFGRLPEGPDELADARRLAIDAINAEPWEKWW